MADLVFDPKKGQEAADILMSICNGEAQEVIVDLYRCVKALGEGNPIVDAPVKVLKDIEGYFNDQFVPHANVLKDHFEQYTDLAAAIQNTEAATTRGGEDLGQIQDTTYDAAKVL